MNNRIRIISFQNAQNYGAILQAFGLMKTIEALGYSDVQFVNYNPLYLRNRYKVCSKRFFDTSNYSFKNKVKFWLTIPLLMVNRVRRNYILNQSRKRLLKQTRRVYHDVSDIKGIKCDLLICGSDQIWSTWITGKPDPVFYGVGGYVGVKRKISYAASSEISTFEKDDNIIILKDLLTNLDSISVREKAVKNAVQKIVDKDVYLCIDPTVLCGREHFSQIASVRQVSAPYILVYSYDIGDPDVHEIIHSIPFYQKYQVHYLSFGSTGLRGTISNNIHGEVSVEDYLSFFKYADYVVTNSFHGLAFSLLFEKPFNVAYKQGLTTRVESLLEQLNLQSRLVKNIGDVSWAPIDYDMVNAELRKVREDSISYLKMNLEKE
ncbi:MAG: polysaccharide pyruvyl transferase family protein [Bacteroidota bacterium]|nr:polysaccharide pyruvyl transferase family protein [Bacteroidota bacterium]